jgi:hypothetical protein
MVPARSQGKQRRGENDEVCVWLSSSESGRVADDAIWTGKRQGDQWRRSDCRWRWSGVVVWEGQIGGRAVGRSIVDATSEGNEMKVSIAVVLTENDAPTHLISPASLPRFGSIVQRHDIVPFVAFLVGSVLICKNLCPVS